MAKISDTEKIFDRVLGYLVEAGPLIRETHEQLDVPLEDLLCAAVRKALSTRAIDCEQQLDLFGETHEPKHKK